MNREEAKVIQRLAVDFPFYSALALKITTKDATTEPFVLNKAQKLVEESIRKDEKAGKPVRKIIVKARQLGCSTYITGRNFWHTATKENINSLLVAHDKDSAKSILGKAQYYLDRLPTTKDLGGINIVPNTKYRTKNELFFHDLNSSWNIETANNANLGRGSTVQHLHLSEAAFYKENAEKAMLSIMQAVPNKKNTSIIFESTANGMDNVFYSYVQNALEGKNDYDVIFLAWYLDDGYRLGDKDTPLEQLDDEEILLREEVGLDWDRLRWRRWAIKNLSQNSVDLFKQEYPSTIEEAFIYTGHPMFDLATLTRMRRHAPLPKWEGSINPVTKNREVLHDHFKIWKEPEPNKVYVLGIDPAMGIENDAADRDFSVVQVLDAQTYEQVACYRARTPIDVFPYVVEHIGNWYNKAYLVPENNNMGVGMINKLLELKYFKMFKEIDYTQQWEQQKPKMGFTTNQKNKSIIIRTLAEMLRDGKIKINDKTTLDEMSKFTQDPSGKMGCNIGHDDTVMALALALHGCAYTPVLNEVATNAKIRLPGRMTMREFAMDGFETLTEEDIWARNNLDGKVC